MLLRTCGVLWRCWRNAVVEGEGWAGWLAGVGYAVRACTREVRAWPGLGILEAPWGSRKECLEKKVAVLPCFGGVEFFAGSYYLFYSKP